MLATLLALSACESGPDYGPYTPLVRDQEERLRAEPCNEAALGELADLMVKGGRPQDAANTSAPRRRTGSSRSPAPTPRSPPTRRARGRASIALMSARRPATSWARRPT
jgi:hypothetical protein